MQAVVDVVFPVFALFAVGLFLASQRTSATILLSAVPSLATLSIIMVILDPKP